MTRSERDAPLNRSSETPPGARIFYGWYIVGATWVMLFLVNAVAVGIFFKPILEEFGLDRATLSAVYTFALLLMAATTPWLGRFIDHFGPRALLFVTLVTQTLGSTINGLATSIWHLFAGRLLYEIKGLQASQVMINRWFVKKRGRAQGIAATGMPIGALVLSPISAFLVINWGWRNAYFFWAALTFIIVLPLTLMMRNSPADKGLSPDGGPPRRPPPAAPEEKVGPEVFMEERGVSLGRASRLGSFWLLNGAQFICGIGCGFVMTHIVIFATDMGYSELIGASLLSVQGGVNLVGVLATGQLSDRYRRSRVLAMTHVIRSVSFGVVVVFVLLGGGSLWILYLAMAMFGFGWFTTSPLTSGCVADFFGNMRMGTIIGLTLSAHTVGMAIGAYAGGYTYDATGSYFLFFMAQAVLELVAAGLAFAIKKSA